MQQEFIQIPSFVFVRSAFRILGEFVEEDQAGILGVAFSLSF
jgi:hypothetical protein